MNPFEKCPTIENEKYILRPIMEADLMGLYKVYSDRNALPFFNPDNCNGDIFYYETIERMKSALDFWMEALKNGWFIRLSIVEKETNTVIGTIENCYRVSSDAFNDFAILRVDVGSQYEKRECLYSIFSLLTREINKFFTVKGIITKAPTYAVERRKALEALGYQLSSSLLIGSDGKAYDGYYELKISENEENLINK